MLPDLSYEQQYLGEVLGIDEVGRGSVAGPVLAAGVIVPKNFNIWDQIQDSKKLTAKKRESLNFLIRKHCQYFISSSSVAEIERLNILQATLLAMRRVINQSGVKCNYILVDGNQSPDKQNQKIKLVIGGDNKSVSIAAASIVAKVERDKIMTDLSLEIPLYEWQQNKGYGTVKHLQLIEKHGITRHHRPSFLKNINNNVKP